MRTERGPARLPIERQELDLRCLHWLGLRRARTSEIGVSIFAAFLCASDRIAHAQLGSGPVLLAPIFLRGPTVKPTKITTEMRLIRETGKGGNIGDRRMRTR